MEILYKAYNDLTLKQLEDILSLRQKVFIIEQKCFYQDIDGFDDQTSHLMFYDGDTLAAYLRVFDKGVKYDHEASLGRIIVEKTYRGNTLGKELVKKGIELCERVPIRIEAQAALLQYYRDLGFIEEGEIYIVDDIDHIQMTFK